MNGHRISRTLARNGDIRAVCSCEHFVVVGYRKAVEDAERIHLARSAEAEVAA